MQSRDMLGNLVSDASTTAERFDAGVKNGDSVYLSNLKVEELQRQRSSPVEINGFTLVVFLSIVGLCGLYFGLRYVVEYSPRWIADYKKERVEKNLADLYTRRTKLFTDFSTPGEWPADLRTTNVAHPSSIVEMVEDCAQRCSTMSPGDKSKKVMLIWNHIASKGQDASATIEQMQSKSQTKTQMHIRTRTRVFIIEFLRTQCAKGVEVACRDLAKGYASNLFYTSDGYGSAATTEQALKQLPPSATSTETEDLRRRIKSFE